MTDTPPPLTTGGQLTEHPDGTFTFTDPAEGSLTLEAQAGRAHPETGPLEVLAALGWHPHGRPTGRHGHRRWTLTRQDGL